MPDTAITEVGQLVESASLLTIEVFRLGADRNLDAQPSAEGVEIAPKYTLDIDIRDDRSGFRIRLMTEINTPFGDIECGAYAEYEHPGVVLGQESSVAASEFVNNVALMHLLPFVRQSIADITQRVFTAPLLMPIIQRGELEFELEIRTPEAKTVHDS